MAAFQIAETPMLSRESSKTLVRAVQTTRLSAARQSKLQRAAQTARQAYDKPLPFKTRAAK